MTTRNDPPEHPLEALKAELPGKLANLSRASAILPESGGAARSGAAGAEPPASLDGVEVRGMAWAHLESALSLLEAGHTTAALSELRASRAAALERRKREVCSTLPGSIESALANLERLARTPSLTRFAVQRSPIIAALQHEQLAALGDGQANAVCLRLFRIVSALKGDVR